MKMTEAEKNERIKAVEKQMAELQKELEDIRNTEISEWDFSAWDKFPLRKKYEFTVPLDLFLIPFNDKIDILMKLMKFKFCYDKDYEPDWHNKDEFKWYMYYCMKTEQYRVDWIVTEDCSSTVYFSSKEVAQKCADWLNAGCPEK